MIHDIFVFIVIIALVGSFYLLFRKSEYVDVDKKRRSNPYYKSLEKLFTVYNPEQAKNLIARGKDFKLVFRVRSKQQETDLGIISSLIAQATLGVYEYNIERKEPEKDGKNIVMVVYFTRK